VKKWRILKRLENSGLCTEIDIGICEEQERELAHIIKVVTIWQALS
jgi:hypothetical protein